MLTLPRSIKFWREDEMGAGWQIAMFGCWLIIVALAIYAAGRRA
jgi:hypothetical protein